MELSVIIPIYNAEPFLDRCLDSVLASIKGLKAEVLLVDNNSTDASPTIIKKYQKKYPKAIVVLKCATPGDSAARNYGVKKARGQYLWFIDADDVIASAAGKELLHAAESGKADLVMMGAYKLHQDGTKLYLPAIDPKSQDYRGRFIRCGLGPWQVLIRRRFWLAYGFSFREGIIQEDMELMPSLILHTDKFASINQPLYYYYETPGSVLHPAEFSPKVYDIFPALEGLLQRFERAGATKQYYADLEWFCIWNLLLDATSDFAKYPEARPGFARSREFLKTHFPNWRRNPSLRKQSLRSQLRIRLNYWK